MHTNLNEFIKHFTGINMQLNWAALAASSPALEIIKVDNLVTIGEFYTPWRATSDGSYADGRNPDATPLQVKTEQFPEQVENDLKPHAGRSIQGNRISK